MAGSGVPRVLASYLLLRDEVVSPSLLQLHDLGGEEAAGQVDGLAVGAALEVRVVGALRLLHALVELARLLVHA